jgi:hypothetical protein
MNGIGLLVALATVGVDVGWESTPSGKLAYTIRIETVLIDKLREGSAIESVVEKEDRAQLRRFRVAVGPKNLQTERQSSSTANEVEYGWRPNDAGGVDYYVQIGPERLETLARGVLLECEVLSDVPSIDKIYVFVGNTTLPRELPPNLANPNLAKTTAWAHDHGAAGDAHNDNVATVSGTQRNSESPRYGNSNYGPQANTQVNVSDANHAATMSQPKATGYGTQAPALADRYGGHADNTIQVPPLNSSMPVLDRNRGYGSSQNQYAPPQAAPARPQQPAQPAYAPQYLPQQQQSPQYVAALQPPPAQNYVAAPSREMNALTEQLTAMQAKLDKVAAAPKEIATPPAHDDAKKPEEKSSLPFVMTALALFCSIGANAYLGWQAWSYFWRFRSVASDLSRARSNAASASRVVAHG